jgi:ribonuclease HII
MKATFELEAVEIKLHGGPIAGVDETGRGPLAGPVVAAAVVLDPERIPNGLAECKTLGSEMRQRLYQEVLATAEVGVGIAEVDRIDADNLTNATLWAMARAIALLPRPPVLALIDGNRAPRLDCRARTIVHGDNKCLSIAAACIVARVTREGIMQTLARRYPGYGFERHKGYGTREHRAAIATHGVTPQHRRSSRPVQLALGLG